jgi:hypothetical protein
MAKPIAATPKLTGKDAKNFVLEAIRNSTSLPTKEERKKLSDSLKDLRKLIEK